MVATGNYVDMVKIAADHGISEVNGVLLDLGFSSRQVTNFGYGLSFQVDEPLDMRYDPDGYLTAEEIVNTYNERDLGRLIRRFGEEPRGMNIARAIIKERPVTTTGQLAEIIERFLGRRPGQRVNPATKTIQSLRIAVNDELSNVELGLEAAAKLLAPEGRLAVISYHSLEDRIIKSFFNKEAHTTTIPAQIALKYNCKLVPIYIERKNGINFEMVIHEPYEITKTGVHEDDLKNNSLTINKKIEKMIIKNPTQWIWTHDRWK